jgi:hypothetical protein
MKRLIYNLVLFVSVISCSKEKQAPDSICADGRIIWTGDPAADGTGWVFAIETESQPSKRYILQNLSSEFQVDGLAVNACVYETDERVTCFCPPTTVLYKYAISSITKK